MTVRARTIKPNWITHLQYNAHSPVERGEVVFQEDRRDGVGRHALLDRGRELDRARVEAQQGLEHGGADHAALVDGSQDGELVVVRLAEAAAVVQVEREG